MEYSLQQISEITGGQLFHNQGQMKVRHIYFDSRRIAFGHESIFIAFKSNKADGHKYLAKAYEKGVRQFLVSEPDSISDLKDVSYVLVSDTLRALQEWATFHRSQFDIPVIAITGSNGKTIVKEWLHQALSTQLNSYNSPGSYNSQIGVALSLLQIEKSHELAIIEAGISEQGEMEHLAKMIKPTHGIMTNIGDAHSHGFDDKHQKINEKLGLFRDVESLIYCYDHNDIREAMDNHLLSKTTSWGKNSRAEIEITEINANDKNTSITIKYNTQIYHLELPVTHSNMVDNCLHVISCLLFFQWSEKDIQKVIRPFSSIPNRLEIKEGRYNTVLINDSYSADLASLKLALEYQDQHAQKKEKAVIITDFLQQKDDSKTSKEIENLLIAHGVKRIIHIGPEARQYGNLEIHNYSSTENCLYDFDFESWEDFCVLIKGARQYTLEKIFGYLSKKAHQTVLETNFSAIAHNLNVFRSLLKRDTQVMAILKAEAYGSGSSELAHFLHDRGIDYMAVAIIDEAVDIRDAGIDTPIMILNVQDNHLDTLWDYNLEPEVYSLRLLEKIISKAKSKSEAIDIHIKIDTGMNRLGFKSDELPEVIRLIKQCDQMKIASVFSHLSSSEDPSQDDFTNDQIRLYESSSNQIIDAFPNQSPKRHILNTHGIIRHRDAQYDMVRIGLGLYGIDDTVSLDTQLQKVHTLKARILQIKKLNKGDRTGYGTAGFASEDKMVAVISIGYADGLMRIAAKNKFSVCIHNQLYPLVGNVCMDVSMVDITGSSHIKEGDEVIIFDQAKPIEDLAEKSETIPYEIISRIAPRVKRTYHYQ